MTSRPRSKAASWVAFLAILLLTLAAYRPVLDNELLNYDDKNFVTANAHVLEGLTPRGMAWAFSTFETGNWQPLTWISHMLDVQLFGTNPAGHHATSLALHAANAMLLFWVLRLLTSRLWPSWLVAIWFALHPLNVESVAWVAERKSVLSTFFALLTIAAYTRNAKRVPSPPPGKTVRARPPAMPGSGRDRLRPALYLLTLTLFALGLMSKPMLVTLPFLLLLLDWWPLGRLDPGRPLSWKGASRLLLEKAPLAALSAVSCALTLAAQSAVGAVSTVRGLGLPARLSNAAVSYVSYLGKMIWPACLAVFYPHPGNTLPAGRALACAALLIALTTLVLWKARRLPHLAVGWLWFAGTLVPVIGLVQVGGQGMADRYAYIPLIGIFIAVAWGGAEAAERLDGRSSSRARSSMAAAGLLAAGLLAVVTRRQVAHWHDSQALFEHALKCTTGNYIAHNMLGKVHYERGDWDKVIEQDSASVAMNPRFAEALYDLGTALLFRDRAADAVPHLKRVIELDPSRAEAHNNLGIALMRLGEPDEALRQFAVATQLSPRYLDARYNLASSLLRSGDVDGAIEHFSKVLELDPANERARSNLQQALARKRQREPADP